MGAINRKFFFDHVRVALFDGSLRQSQVDGLDGFLDRWEKFHKTDDLRWLAYMLGTTHHETDHKIQPIEEYGKGKGHAYGKPDPVTHQKYYGRGFVQITHKGNYQRMGDILHVDLVHHPELALDFDIALRIIFFGMTNGTFTGKQLSDYFNPNKGDWVNARRIVNGTDKAQSIATLSRKYYAAISFTTL